MQSTTDIEFMMKQANILSRLYRGATGAVKAAPKGALFGGLLGAGVTGATMGLAPALGVGGAGLYAGGLFGGAARGALGGLKGLFSKSPQILAREAAQVAAPASGRTMEMIGQHLASSRAAPLAAGAGIGYMLSDDDNKLMGSALGAVGGLMARPKVLEMLARRAGRVA